MDKKLIHSIITMTLNPDGTIERITKKDRFGVFDKKNEKVSEVDEASPLKEDDLKTLMPDCARLLAQISDWENNGPPGMRRVAKSAREVSVVKLRKVLATMQPRPLIRNFNDSVAGLGPEAQIEWEYGDVIARDCPWFERAATRIGLTPVQIDELFLAARTLS
jgi:hypothetical protein